MKKFLVVFTTCIILLVPRAFPQFSLSGEFRPRTEFSRGYKTLATEGQDMSVATTQRTRLNAMYSSEGLRTRLVLQDVRNWGSQPQLAGNEDFAASIHEAWAEISLSADVSFRAGRQELVYDDHRILGNVGWAQQARSHDLILFKYEKDFKIHAGIAHHQNADITNNIYNGPDAYKNLQFAWFNKSWGNTGMSLLLLNNGVPVLIAPDVEESRYSQILGGRVTKQLRELSMAANLYAQTGQHRSGAKIRALNFLIEASANNGLTAGYEYLSGNSYDKPGKVHAFEPLYGTNHKFNGYMDYFYVGNHINSVGLHDGYLKYSHNLDRLRLDADIHYFASGGKINADARRYLGTEVDLGIAWTVRPAATISTGWSVMFAGESLEPLRGGDRHTGQHWGYIMLTVIPAFICE